MKKVLALLVLFSLIWGFGITSYTLDKEKYSPGDSGIARLTLSLTHPLDTGERLKEFRGIIVELGGVGKGTVYLGDMDGGEITFSVPFSIPKDTPSGIYNLYAKASATAVVESGGATKMDVDSSAVTIPIKVVETPKLSAEVIPYVISERSDVKIRVCNKGGEAREISVRVSNGVELAEGALYIERVGKGECVEERAELDSNAEGRISALFTISYKDALGEEGETSLYVPLIVDKSSATISISQLNSILSEKESIIKLEISNKGNDATDIHISPGKGLSFTGKSDVSIDELKAGESKEIEELVYTELEPGVHKVEFTIRWKEDGKEKVETIEVPIVVSAEEGLEVYLDADPAPLEEGKKSSLSVIVANKAGYEIRGLSVEIESDLLELLDVSNRRFIGSLESDDFSSEQFLVLPRKSGEGTVKVFLTYKDPSGKEMNETKVVKVRVRASEEGINWIPIAAILVAGGLGYVIVRRKKR